MDWRARSLSLGTAALALTITAAALAAPGRAATPTVTMYDNDAPPPSQGFHEAQGWWGYAPQHLIVKRGETVVFHNPSTNRYPHTVTSIARTAPTAYTETLAAGTVFDSSPDSSATVRPGQSWTLDTSGLEQGHYLYYCRLHMWMVGSLTVVP